MFYLILGLLCFFQLPNSKKFSLSGTAQGTYYNISYYHQFPIVDKAEIDSVFNALDHSLSVYKQNSLISIFNRNDSVLMDAHLKFVVEKSLHFYKLSNGLFDIAVYPLVEAWGFGVNTHQIAPDSIKVKNLLNCTGSHLLSIKNNWLFKNKNCVQIDVNGIAQGYSVDVVANFLLSKNINSFIVEIGGEIVAKGKKPDGTKWVVGIEKPGSNSLKPVIQSAFFIENAATTTSGNYRRFYENNGKTVSHTINPLTGYPVENELVSVTVTAPDAITADACDNILMLLGLENSMNFLKEHPQLGAYFIYKTANGEIMDTAVSFSF